jgi:hypothetical protein
VKFKHISVVNLTVVFCCKLHSNRRFVRQNVSLRKPPVQTHSQFEEISANSEESYRMFGLKRNQFAETTKPHTEWSLTIFMTWHNNLPQVKASWKWSPPSLTDDFHLVATLLITVWSYCPEWQTISSRLCPPPLCLRVLISFSSSPSPYTPTYCLRNVLTYYSHKTSDMANGQDTKDD